MGAGGIGFDVAAFLSEPATGEAQAGPVPETVDHFNARWGINPALPG
jgi:hypothetical protein